MVGSYEAAAFRSSQQRPVKPRPRARGRYAKTPKNPLLLADDSNWRCRESLRRAVERVVREALDEGWKPEDIAISLVEVADEHMDQMIGEAICPGHPIVIH